MKKIISLFIGFILVFLTVTDAYALGNTDESVVEADTEVSGTAVSVNARAYVLMDRNTGTVLMASNEHEKLYPASVTKIMTLILVCEAIENGKLSLESEITCSESAANKGGSQIWLEAGEVMTVDELLRAVVVYSANDACCLLGESVAGSESAFCAMMNDKAKELGMNNTYFDNCTGLDDDTTEHKSTAYDIALMSARLLEYELIRNYTSIWMDTLRDGTTQLVNTNKLMRTYPGATGLKTGTTSKAGCCVSASAERDGLELIAVVMGADNSKERFAGAAALLDWGFANYEIYTPQPDGAYETEIKVIHGTKQITTVTHTDVSEILIPKGSAGGITTEVQCQQEITAPVTEGQCVGSVTFYSDGKEIGRCELLTTEGVEEMTMKNALTALFLSLKNN